MTSTQTKGRRRRGTREERSQAAQAELTQLINESGPISRLRNELSQYPTDLFKKVCALYRERNDAVPDYLLGLVPYLGEVSLRALEQSKLIQRLESNHAMHAYVPTPKGEKLWKQLERQPAGK